MTSSLRRATRRLPADRPRAAVYCRISDDRHGLGLGVERQREDCHALAGRNGWAIVGTFIDNDVSAYSGKPRPEYAALMAAVRAGAVGAAGARARGRADHG